ncbi:GIY-YIG nuclease family protein, partial [Carnobacterium sp.]|uniref:GIY-YIG nuclease family protein n=1 Tax=Carnobacterium sp. TaxID=48221 RepID=UPI003C745552
DNAVGLENELHKKLSNQRINKVNYRKEFFRVDILELENLVGEIDPTAEFNKTMFAEEYSQTLALEENLIIESIELI